MPAHSQTQPPERGDLLPFKATERTLANGLKVIVVPDRLPEHRVRADPGADGLAQRGGAGKSGFAHFFEHMMFRGTAEYPPEKWQGS
jgi:zinc protease